MKLDYAEFFNLYYYEGGYKVISVTGYDDYLIVPEGAEIPETDLIVLQQPLDKIYLQATAVMALFRALDGLSNIRFVGTQASGWSIEEAVDAIERGDMIFAGKYSEPDYETLVEHEANLAIESTMILHSPKVKEILESLDIPVFVEYSAYEPEALGRTEWVKVYAAMLNIEEKAYDFFDEQEEVIKMVEDCEKSDKTVVYFYIGTEGTAIVPNDNTYTIGMIRTAGGNYVFDGLQESFDSPTVALSMEEFYAKAIDADYIIYNSSIDGSLASTDELLTKSSLLADFKAVKEGNVWCTGKSLFQSTDRLAYMILDIYNMLNGADADEMTFLQKIE
ncbi:MAG: ABC transporter substrate-binding protein [Lachnospiraceae bacterium]|nr:ABC transporter substrate-binding protein [Candidatus Equihabitans merdae]